MITGITIRNFMGIREVKNLPLDAFHVLIGPNGSGKSTFLRAINFVHACLAAGPRRAVDNLYLPNFDDLTYLRQGGPVEIELWLDLGDILPKQAGSLVRYTLGIRRDDRLGIAVDQELLLLYSKSWLRTGKRFEFTGRAKPKRLLGKTSKNTDFYKRENGKRQDTFDFGMNKSTLSLVLPDETMYPTGNALKRLLTEGVRYLQLNSRAMRLPASAKSDVLLELEGGNLARVVGGKMMGRRQPLQLGGVVFDGEPRKKEWEEHLRHALPALAQIGWGRFPHDNSEFLVLKYQNGFECPAWIASDGTLRMLALTLPAFLPESPCLYLVEEPENGVHPQALEIIISALASIPSGQTLIATHSPLVVRQVGRGPLLCFSRDDNGVKIVPGDQHPALRDWDGTPDLATFYTAGVLQ